MRDDIKAQARRQIKVLFQHILLKAVELFRFPALGRPVEVIQARFPDGGQGNVLRLPEKLVRPVCRGVMGIVRMDAQRTKNRAGKLARPRRVCLPVIHPRPQRNHAVNAFPEGMLDVSFPAGLVELSGSQMAVRVNNHGVRDCGGTDEVCGYLPALKSANAEHA